MIKSAKQIAKLELFVLLILASISYADSKVINMNPPNGSINNGTESILISFDVTNINPPFRVTITTNEEMTNRIYDTATDPTFYSTSHFTNTLGSGYITGGGPFDFHFRLSNNYAYRIKPGAVIKVYIFTNGIDPFIYSFTLADVESPALSFSIPQNVELFGNQLLNVSAVDDSEKDVKVYYATDGNIANLLSPCFTNRSSFLLTETKTFDFLAIDTLGNQMHRTATFTVHQKALKNPVLVSQVVKKDSQLEVSLTSGARFQAEIFNLHGVLIYQVKDVADEFIWNAEGSRAGVYYLVLSSDKGFMNRYKFLIQD